MAECPPARRSCRCGDIRKRKVKLHDAAANLAVVPAGNLFGGSVLAGLVYHVIYRLADADAPPVARDRSP